MKLAAMQIQEKKVGSAVIADSPVEGEGGRAEDLAHAGTIR